MKKDTGAILLLFLPIFLSLFLMLGLALHMGQAHASRDEMQTVVDHVLISTLRIREEGLSKMADRWSSIGQLMAEGDDQGGTILSTQWDSLENAAHTWSNALSGYQGRVKAVMTVVMEANRARREDLTVQDDASLSLGISLQPVMVRDEANRMKQVHDAWPSRQWAPENRLGEPDERLVLMIQTPMKPLPVPFIPAPQWTLRAGAGGRLRWDVDQRDPLIQLTGNGGFPRTWEEALNGPRVDPFRTALYRSSLDE